jgi:outer membrane protein assembly factor BamC
VTRLLLVALAALSVSGCGYLFGDDGVFRDTSDDYRTAQELPVMKMPDEKGGDDLQEIYAIPEITGERAVYSSDNVPRPAPLLSASADQLVRIQRLGDDTWALVAIAPGQLWPQVRSFLSAANVSVGRVDARAGIIESAYLDLQDQDRQARFRFRVERGVQRGNSELHVLQMFRTSDDNVWPAQSDDVELESEMLRSVAQFIANSADTAPVSMMAEQSISATGRVTVVEEGRDSYIRLELPFERAWASVAKALQSSGFEITDRNRSEGIYYLNYQGEADGQESSGWFGWLGGDDQDAHPLTGVPLLMTMAEASESTVIIRLATEEGRSASPEDLLTLLQLVKGNIN